MCVCGALSIFSSIYSSTAYIYNVCACMVLSVILNGTSILHVIVMLTAVVAGQPSSRHLPVSIVGFITDKWMPTASFTLHSSDDGNNNNNKDDDDDGFHELCVFKMMSIIKRC